MIKTPRFVILGTGGNFTFHVIQTLIKKKYRPISYIQSGDRPQQGKTTFANIQLDVIKPKNILSQLLEANDIPIKYQSQINIKAYIQKLNVDYILVACWPQLIPNNIVQSVNKASLNLHPSLLPKFRGIDPVAEQLLTDDKNFGISLHYIDETYDTGDIVLQKPLSKKINQDRAAIHTEAAKKGAELFIQAINAD